MREKEEKSNLNRNILIEEKDFNRVFGKDLKNAHISNMSLVNNFIPLAKNNEKQGINIKNKVKIENLFSNF